MTTPQYRDFKHTADIDLISHLALNQITFEDDTETLHVLKEVLALYNYDSSHDGQMINKALLSAKTKRVTARHPDSVKQGFCRGVEISITVDEKPLLDHNAYLLGSVLHEFFSKSCSVNSFSRLVLHSKQRGEVGRWHAKLGSKYTL